jgi:hypothetical protein
MTGRPLADTPQVAPRRTELEQIVEGGDPVDPAERKAEFVGRVLESLLGQIAIMVLALLQNGDQGIRLAAIALQDGGQLRRACALSHILGRLPDNREFLGSTRKEGCTVLWTIDNALETGRSDIWREKALHQRYSF